MDGVCGDPSVCGVCGVSGGEAGGEAVGRSTASGVAASNPSSGSPSTGASHHATDPNATANPRAMPPIPAARFGAMSLSTATRPPNTASTPIHVVARRRSPCAPITPTTAPAATARKPPSSTLLLPPSTMAPTSVSNAPTATNGVAAPAYRFRSSAAPAPRKTRPITRVMAAVESVELVVPSVDVNDEEPSVSPKFVDDDDPLELETSLWNGTMFVLSLPAISNAAQPAKTSRVPARNTARPFVQVSR